MVAIGDQVQLYVLTVIGICTLAIALFNAVHVRRSLMDAAHDLLQLWAGGVVLLFALEGNLTPSSEYEAAPLDDPGRGIMLRRSIGVAALSDARQFARVPSPIHGRAT